jgi:hypothetical protein
VYLPQVAFVHITKERAHYAAQRLGYRGALRWEASTDDLPRAVKAGWVRVSCSVGLATVFIFCFRELAAIADAKRDSKELIAIAAAVKQLLDGIDAAMGDPARADRRDAS